MSYDLLRTKLTTMIGKEVVVTLSGRVGSTESTLSSVGLDYIELKCKAESNSLIIPMEALTTIIQKS